MSNDSIVVFTAKSIERILSEGGTSSWRLDRNHARKCTYAVCTRNANATWVEGAEAHHAAFLVGKVQEVVQAPSGGKERKDRFLIEFSEYALVDVPGVWRGERNPVKYASLEDLGIDIATLEWKPMPSAKAVPRVDVVKKSEANGALTMAEAKKGLALFFGVSPEAIEITIRG